MFIKMRPFFKKMLQIRLVSIFIMWGLGILRRYKYPSLKPSKKDKSFTIWNQNENMINIKQDTANTLRKIL